MKKNIKLVLEYDGSRYDGWQKQGNTDNTIQGKLEAILLKWTGEEIEVHGSGRTDAGVHARGQVANFHVDSKVCGSAGEAKRYLNRYLPEDIRVIGAEEMPERFHSRLNATRKTYAYFVETADKKDVFQRKYVYGLGERLNLEAMRKAASYLIGEHDFKSFCSNKKMKKSTVRRLDAVAIRECGTCIVFEYTGNGFLYNMVRIIAGTLLEIGCGNMDESVIQKVFEEKIREYAGPTLPACGLKLVEVFY